MKVLIYLALVGVIVSEVCHAQITCNPDEITTYTQQLATCTTSCPTGDLCECCSDASSAANAVECCSAYTNALNCEDIGIDVSPCSALSDPSNGAVTTTVAFVVNGVLVLLSAAITQLFL